MAGKQGSIVRGDQLLSINGTSVQTADHASVVELLEDRYVLFETLLRIHFISVYMFVCLYVTIC